MIYTLDISHPDLKITKLAGDYLHEGRIVIFPTETVYGIGANASIHESVTKIYDIKNRPRNKPFSWHFHSLDAFFAFAGDGISEEQAKWFKKLIPNPVTLIYYDSIRRKKIGVRFPENKIAKLILEDSACPVIATSANFSGDPPPSTIKDIPEELIKMVELVIDSGETEKMIESTVIDITKEKPVILRQGAFKFENDRFHMHR